MSAAPSDMAEMRAILVRLHETIAPARLPPALHADAVGIVRTVEAHLAHVERGEPLPRAVLDDLKVRIMAHVVACGELVLRRREADA